MNRSSLMFLLTAAILMSALFATGVDEGRLVVQPAAAVESRLKESDSARDLRFRLYDPKSVVVELDEFDEPIPFAPGENFIAAKRELKHEVVNVELERDGSVEYKIEMKEGDVFVYRWSAKSGEVYYDFHGHPHQEETEFFNRYVEGEGSSHSGAIIAAFTGQHGWFWLNISEEPIVLQLEVSGFYDRIINIPVGTY